MTICLVASVMFGACGRPHGTSVKDATVSRRPLVVAMSGWNSCGDDGSPLGMPMNARLSVLTQRLTKALGDAPRFVISCFTMGDELHFVTSTRPTETEYGGVGSISQAIEVEAAQASRVYVIGHSHGGWLAMKVDEALRGKVHLEGLVTLDPISKVDCGLGAEEKGLFPGCERAPTDMSHADRLLIHDNARQWSNYFQTDEGFLHSSAISEADYNEQRYYDSYWNAHNRLNLDPQIWDAIATRILAGPTLATR